MIQNEGVPHPATQALKGKNQAVKLGSGALFLSDRNGRQFILKPKSVPGGVTKAVAVLAENRPPAPPVGEPVSPPEELGRVINSSLSLQAVWSKACQCAFSHCRFLIRAKQLDQLLADLGTTRYRMESLGLRPVCRAGVHTTLFGLSDALTRYVCSAIGRGQDTVPVWNCLERAVVRSIHRRHGTEIRAKALPEILGGGSICERLIKTGELSPSLKTKNRTLYPLKSVEDVVGLLEQGWIPKERKVARKGRQK
jgi:hypothetical protein